MEIKNILRTVTPSLSVMVLGVVGAYFVYNVYFAELVASDFAGYEPAAGEETVTGHDAVTHIGHTEGTGTTIEEIVEEEVVKSVEDTADTTAETTGTGTESDL